MKINSYLIYLACLMIGIFGGVFIQSYLKTDDLYLDQFFGAFAGCVLLISSLIWRIRNKFFSCTVMCHFKNRL